MRRGRWRSIPDGRSLRSRALAATLLSAAAAGPVRGALPDEPARQLEECLTEHARDRSGEGSDHGVLLASRYRRIRLDPWFTAERRRQALLAVLARCRQSGLAATGRRRAAPVGLALVAGPETVALVDDGDRSSLREAVAWALAAARRSRAALLPFGDRCVARKDLEATLAAFARLLDRCPDAHALAAAVARRFDVYRSPGLRGTGEVLFTGYCDPAYRGALAPAGEYRHPVYREPRAAGIPDGRHTRAEVARGALAGRGLELAWLADPLDAYLLEVEGSGLIALPDGRFLRLEYAGKNGRPYRSLAKAMVAAGLVSPWEIGVPSIRRYFAARPDRLRALLDENPSQVYFRGTLLPAAPRRLAYVPGRSVACDMSVFPRAGLGFVSLERPRFVPGATPPALPGAAGLVGAGSIAGWSAYSRFVVNHDTGSAIQGPGRIDLYLGSGAEAERLAGDLREPGALCYLLLKGTPLRD
jgi:membrane-bound lytic murein transglycosylase A